MVTLSKWCSGSDEPASKVSLSELQGAFTPFAGKEIQKQSPHCKFELCVNTSDDTLAVTYEARLCCQSHCLNCQRDKGKIDPGTKGHGLYEQHSSH